jgi:hypothetical protein
MKRDGATSSADANEWNAATPPLQPLMEREATSSAVDGTRGDLEDVLGDTLRVADAHLP